MRTNIEFKLTCANCGQDLEACSDKSEMEYHSARNATANMKIKPCSKCHEEAQRPAKLLKEAMRCL
jgi:hypothetical protein